MKNWRESILADAQRDGFIERVVQYYIPHLAELLRFEELKGDYLAAALSSALGRIWLLATRAVLLDDASLRELRKIGRGAPSSFQSMTNNRSVVRRLINFITGVMSIRERDLEEIFQANGSETLAQAEALKRQEIVARKRQHEWSKDETERIRILAEAYESERDDLTRDPRTGKSLFQGNEEDHSKRIAGWEQAMRDEILRFTDFESSDESDDFWRLDGPVRARKLVYACLRHAGVREPSQYGDAETTALRRQRKKPRQVGRHLPTN